MTVAKKEENGNANGNVPRINWSAVISFGMLLLVIVGAFYNLAFIPVRERFDAIEKRHSDINDTFIRIQSSLDARRLEFPTQLEFKQFEGRVLDRIELIQKQLLLLEQTRPTTGELSAFGKSNEINVTKLEERIRSLEIYIRQSR